jgi:hypothetical protein
MALGDETLPAVAGGPASQPTMTQTQLLEFTNMNGVNASLDALVGGGMRPEDAAAMLENAGYDLGDLAAPEDVAGGAAAPAQQVRRAEPNIKPTGAVMDVGFIAQLNNAGSQEEFNQMYDALPKVQQHIYDRSFAQDIDPAWASQKAEEFYQMQDQASAPQVKLAEMRLSAIEQGTKEDAKKTYQRADNMIFLMDNLRGGPRDKVPAKNEKWRSRVGSVQGRWPTMLSSEETLGWNADFNSLKGSINLAEAQGNRGQGALSDGERVLMAQAASLGLEQARDEPGFEASFERMYDMALEARQASEQKMSGKAVGAASAAGSAAPAKPRRVSGGITYEKGDDGLWNPVQ